MASNDLVESSERTVFAIPVSSSFVIPNNLSSAHHFVSIKLTSRNYLLWRTQLVPFLRGQNLLGFVDGSLPCPLATLGEDASSATVNPAFAGWVQ